MNDQEIIKRMEQLQQKEIMTDAEMQELERLEREYSSEEHQKKRLTQLEQQHNHKQRPSTPYGAFPTMPFLQKEDTQPIKYTCKHCHQIFSNFYELGNHMRHVNSEARKYKRYQLSEIPTYTVKKSHLLKIEPLGTSIRMYMTKLLPHDWLAANCEAVVESSNVIWVRFEKVGEKHER